jgi:hypothetical protein
LWTFPTGDADALLDLVEADVFATQETDVARAKQPMSFFMPKR